MEVAAWNAIYFKDPTEFTGTRTNARLYGTYPTDFSDIYAKAQTR
jgi:hypothetical protein